MALGCTSSRHRVPCSVFSVLGSSVLRSAVCGPYLCFCGSPSRAMHSISCHHLLAPRCAVPLGHSGKRDLRLVAPALFHTSLASRFQLQRVRGLCCLRILAAELRAAILRLSSWALSLRIVCGIRPSACSPISTLYSRTTTFSACQYADPCLTCSTPLRQGTSVLTDTELSLHTGSSTLR